MTTTTNDNGSASVLDVARGLVPLVREHADRGEHERRLPAPVADAFTKAGMFRLCRPRELGGWEADPLTLYSVIEELARADGSAGWCALISGAGALFEGFIRRTSPARCSPIRTRAPPASWPHGSRGGSGWRLPRHRALVHGEQLPQLQLARRRRDDASTATRRARSRSSPTSRRRTAASSTWKVSGLSGPEPRHRGQRPFRAARPGDFASVSSPRSTCDRSSCSLLRPAVERHRVGHAGRRPAAIDELTRLASAKTPHGGVEARQPPHRADRRGQGRGLLRSSRVLVRGQPTGLGRGLPGAAGLAEGARPPPAGGDHATAHCAGRGPPSTPPAARRRSLQPVAALLPRHPRDDAAVLGRAADLRVDRAHALRDRARLSPRLNARSPKRRSPPAGWLRGLRL